MRKKIDRFVVQDVLSESSGGSVYKALEQLPGGITRPVALKVLGVIADGDSKAEQRFHSEVQLSVALGGHPHIVAVYSMGITERLPWLAMEYLPTTLASQMGELPAAAEQVRRMMRQVAMGLKALHGLNPPVLHNDLTPSNILISSAGDFKISDFGMASPVSVERTRGMATVKYAAPELLSHDLGTVSPATDLYALGHIAYELALGGKLYRQQFPAVYDARGAAKEATPAKWMAWHCSMNTQVTAAHEVLPGFPESLGATIARLMNKTPAARYPTADALLAELQETAQAPAAAMPLPLPLPMPAPVAMPTRSTDRPPETPVRQAPASSGERYYVRLGGRTSGPFDLAVLQQQARRNLLSRLHQISTDRVTWRSAGSIEGLFHTSQEETE